jgi:hypothetical protein
VALPSFAWSPFFSHERVLERGCPVISSLFFTTHYLSAFLLALVQVEIDTHSPHSEVYNALKKLLKSTSQESHIGESDASSAHITSTPPNKMHAES